MDPQLDYHFIKIPYTRLCPLELSSSESSDHPLEESKVRARLTQTVEANHLTPEIRLQMIQDLACLNQRTRDELPESTGSEFSQRLIFPSRRITDRGATGLSYPSNYAERYMLVSPKHLLDLSHRMIQTYRSIYEKGDWVDLRYQFEARGVDGAFRARMTARTTDKLTPFRRSRDLASQLLSISLTPTEREIQEDPLFIEKKLLPSSAQVLIIGDIHSNLSSLQMIFLDWQRQGWLGDDYQLSKNKYVVCTGDLVDRGPKSCEVLVALWKLFLANPGRVWLLNGNHEDIDVYSRYGFAQELKEQLQKMLEEATPEEIMEIQGRYHDQLQEFIRFSETETQAPCRQLAMFINHTLRESLYYLPTVLFLRWEGTERWYQLCHGALHQYEDLSLYQPLPFLQSEASYGLFADDDGEMYASKSSFKWGDFAQKNLDRDPRVADSRPLFTQEQVAKYLRENQLQAIISGHQDASPILLLNRHPESTEYPWDTVYQSYQLHTVQALWEALPAEGLDHPGDLFDQLTLRPGGKGEDGFSALCLSTAVFNKTYPEHGKMVHNYARLHQGEVGPAQELMRGGGESEIKSKIINLPEELNPLTYWEEAHEEMERNQWISFLD